MNEPKTTPAAAKLACIQCGALYPALPGSNGLCPACAKKAARTAVCAKCGKPFALPRGGRWPKTCPACRPERHTKGARGPYFGDTAQKPPAGAAGAEKATPRRAAGRRAKAPAASWVPCWPSWTGRTPGGERRDCRP